MKHYWYLIKTDGEFKDVTRYSEKEAQKTVKIRERLYEKYKEYGSKYHDYEIVAVTPEQYEMIFPTV